MIRSLFFLIGLICLCTNASAQKVTDGDFENLRDVHRCRLVYDYSSVQITRFESGVESLAQEIKEKAENWCRGSICHELGDRLRIGDFEKIDAVLSIKVLSMDREMKNPVMEAQFVSKWGATLLTISDIKDEDFNDAGHKLGEFIHKKLKKLK